MADIRTKINTLNPQQAIDTIRMFNAYLEGLIETLEETGDVKGAEGARKALAGLGSCLDLAMTGCGFIDTK